MSLNNPIGFNTEIEAKLALQREGKRLKMIADKLWRQYLDTHQGRPYRRTNKADEKAIKLGRVKRLDAFTWGIELSFVDELSYHDSIVSKDKKPKGHAFMLISEGWQVQKGSHKGVKDFGYFTGINYIGRVIQEYNDSAPKGITLKANWAGEPFSPGRDKKKVLKGR